MTSLWVDIKQQIFRLVIYPIWWLLSPPPILDTSPPQLVHSPLFLDNLLSFPHKPQNWIMKKVKCSQMLLVTKHEQTHQVAHTMNRDHKFYADLEYKSRCMDEPMGILKWWNLQHSSSKNKNFTANLNNNSFPHTFLPPLSNQIFTALFIVKFKTGQGSMSFSMLFAWWSLSLLETVKTSVSMACPKLTIKKPEQLCRRRILVLQG